MKRKYGQKSMCHPDQPHEAKGIAIKGRIRTDRWSYYSTIMIWVSELDSYWDDKNMIMVF